ncbi:chromate resistance protein ChrB domain-containing protein [Xanthobacter autotrophicus]|uniref:chromate resistance protein ChrB domain-containing protein n=1 Tax=Xanthobacter autotrophicus TaxID=280 RepID=UPI001E48DBC7|nr:chromate resistance protein ChrB domain-containing protein [Xanthobacter autotrophicus]UDQ91718.1 chromate resistance protein [Xanthobacter autotrophicus]
MNDDDATEQRWLLLIHQLPTKPAYFRVKIWRRLQGIGAVAVKSSVYALPASVETQEDFQWLVKEIAAGGGEAMVCEARLVDGLTDAQVRALFDAARDTDYAAIAEDARAIAAALDADGSTEKRAEARSQIGRLRRRLSDTVSLDFFEATGRVVAEGLIVELEARTAEDKPMTSPSAQPPADLDPLTALKGHVWVTRRDVHVDRIACGWLIRRFIDPDAEIRFVPGKGYVPKPGELRFDMFEGEVTHEGDRCSFEVLLGRAGLTDPALQAVGEIVHDIDLKDGKFRRDEAGGISSLIAGIAMSEPDDAQRLVKGAGVFDTLYQYFRARRP